MRNFDYKSLSEGQRAKLSMMLKSPNSEQMGLGLRILINQFYFPAFEMEIVDKGRTVPKRYQKKYQLMRRLFMFEE